MSNFKYTHEVCNHCGEEVKLNAQLAVQTCPHCGMRIVACSMCLANDDAEENYCATCCLCYQAEQENKGRKPKPAYYISQIAQALADTGEYEVGFFCKKDKPTFRRDGVLYEIFAVYADDDGAVRLDVAAIDPWSGPKLLELDDKWRCDTLKRISSFVEDEINSR